MKIPTIETICAVCGGKGQIPLTEAHLEWYEDVQMVHTDPSICIAVLKLKTNNEKLKEHV